MTLNDLVKDYLKQIKTEYEHMKDYVDFKMFDYDQIDEEQIGYSVDPDGNSLIDGEEGSWNKNWVVIGCDNLCGDPIIVDLSEQGYPISILLHGMGSWESGYYLSSSMDSFIEILKDLNKFLTHKEILQGNKRIQYKEVKAFIDSICKKNEYTDYDSWESLLSPIVDLSKKHDENIKKMIKEKLEDNVGVLEIANLLSISTKDVYEYVKEIRKL